MLCPKCGKEIHEDDVICLNCGNLLTSTYVSVNENSNQIQPTIVDNQGNQIVDSSMSSMEISGNVNQFAPNYSNVNESNNIIKEEIPKFDFFEENKSNMNSFNEININDAITPEQIAAMEMNNSYNEITTDQIINNGYVSNLSMDENNNMSNLISDIENSQSVESSNYIKSVENNNVLQEENVIPSVIPPVDVVQVNPYINSEVQNVEVKEEPTELKNKKEKKHREKKLVNKKGLYIIVGVVISILVISLVCYYYIFNKAPAEYVVNDDKFPSITAIVGSRNLETNDVSNEDDIIIKTYHYNKVKNVMNDLYQYINYLTQSLNFINTTAYDLNEETGTIQLGNESITEGYVIVVTIKYNVDEYTITIKRAPGTLTRY